MVAPDDQRVGRCGFCKLEGDGVEEFFCHRYEIVLGRRSKSTRLDVVLGDNMNISRQHARIAYNFDTKHWELEVMGKNGVTVNGTLYTPSSSHVRLRSRDLVTMGENSFHFLLPSKVSRHLEGGQPVVKRQRTITQRASPAPRASPLPITSSAAPQHGPPLPNRALAPVPAAAAHPVKPEAARASAPQPARPQIDSPPQQSALQQLQAQQQQQQLQQQPPEGQQQARPPVPRITLADQMQQQALVQHALAERQRRALEQAVKLREAEARLDAQDRERAQEQTQVQLDIKNREGVQAGLTAQDHERLADRERAQNLLVAQEKERAQARLEAQQRALAQQHHIRPPQQDLKQDELPYAMPSQPRQQQVISLPFPPQQQQPQPIRLPQSTSVRIPLHQTVYRQLQQQQQREEDGGSQTQSQARAPNQILAQQQMQYQLPPKTSSQYPVLMQAQRTPNSPVGMPQQQRPTVLHSTPLPSHASKPQHNISSQPVSTPLRQPSQLSVGPSSQSQPLIHHCMPMRTMTILPQQLSASAQQLSPALLQSQPQQSPFQQQQHHQHWARSQALPTQYIQQGSSQLAAQPSFGSRPSIPSPFTGMRTASSGHMVIHPSLTLARPPSVPISLSIPQNGQPDRSGPADSRPSN